MIDDDRSSNDDRLARLVQVFDGRKWPVVKAVDVYIRPGDSVHKVSQTVLTELGLRKWRFNKYTLAIGTTHGHVVAFLKGNDIILKAFCQCLAKDKCILLIKKPSQGSKKLFKTKLNMSDTLLYTQDRGTDKQTENLTSSTQNMFQYQPDNKDKKQIHKTQQPKKTFVPIPELGIFTPEQHVLHNGTFAQHCHLGDVRNNNSSETIHNTDRSVDSSLDDSTSSYGFNHSNRLQKRANHQKYDDIYHSCMDLSEMNEAAKTGNVSRMDSFKVKPIRDDNVQLDSGLKSCSLNDMKSVSAMTFKGSQTLVNQRQQNSQMLQSCRDNPYSNGSANRHNAKLTVNSYNGGGCNYEREKKNLPTQTRASENHNFWSQSSDSHTGNHYQSSEYRSDQPLRNGYRSHGQQINTDQFNPHQTNTDQCYGQGEQHNFKSQMSASNHERFSSESQQSKSTSFPPDHMTSAMTSSVSQPSHSHRSSGFVLQRSESIHREDSPMKPKRSLPSVPGTDGSDRVKKLTELMRSRMAVRSNSQPKTSLEGPHTNQGGKLSERTNLVHEKNVFPTNQSVNTMDQRDFVKRANGQLVGFMYREDGPDLKYSQNVGEGNWRMQDCTLGQVRAEPYTNRCGDHASDGLSHGDRGYFDNSLRGNYLEEAPILHADHSSDSAHTSATSTSVLDSGYTSNSESYYMNQQDMPIFHPHPTSQWDSNGNRQDYLDSRFVSSPKYQDFQNCNTLNRRQSNLLSTHRFGSVQNISSAQAHGSPKDSHGRVNSRQRENQNFKDINNSTNTIHYPERYPHRFQARNLPEQEIYKRSTQSINLNHKQFLPTTQHGQEGHGRISKPVVVDRYSDISGELCDQNISNKTDRTARLPNGAPGGNDRPCSNSSLCFSIQKISLFEIVQKFDLIPVHIRLPPHLSLMSLLSLKVVPVSRVTDISHQKKPANIGGPRSAFTPVKSLTSPDSPPTAALIGFHNVSWDIHRYSSLGDIASEDIIVEVNGTSCLDVTLEQLELTLNKCAGTFSLTVARSKEKIGETQTQRIKSLEAEIARLDDILQAREDKIHALRKAHHFKDSFHHIDSELVIAGLELGEDEYVV